MGENKIKESISTKCVTLMPAKRAEKSLQKRMLRRKSAATVLSLLACMNMNMNMNMRPGLTHERQELYC